MKPPLQLRSAPQTLTNADVRAMLRTFNFYCKAYPWNADYANDDGGFAGNFVDHQDGTLTDQATGLMWQQGQAPDYAPWKGAQPYIDSLNAEHFAGYADWRLPTLEELGTLMTREKLNDGLYVSPVFSNKMWFWSCDPGGAGAGRNWTDSHFAWAINFDYGSVFCLETSNAQDIRAVRTAVVSPARALFREQLAFRARGDFAGLVAAQYARDVSLVTGGASLRGTAALLQHLRDEDTAVGRLADWRVESFAASDDVIAYSLRRASNHGPLLESAVLHLADGRIRRHIVFPPRAERSRP